MAHPRHIVYKRRAWETVTGLVRASQHNLCADCLSRGELRPVEEVHHIIPLTDENYTDPEIAYGLGNLVGLCHECHEERHRRLGTYSRSIPRMWFDENGMPRPKGVDVGQAAVVEDVRHQADR